MKKVGIYVFTDKIKQRSTKSREGYFDGQNFIGLRYIISEIDKGKYEITYVSKDTVNDVDFVLISLTSYYDVINLINELHGKSIDSTVIVGGPGCINVELMAEIVDIAIVGRGEGIINHLLDGDCEINGVWYKQSDPDINKKLKIRTLSQFIEIDDKYLGTYRETSVGCERKCYFCEYSWKNKLITKNHGYKSGIANRETRLEDLDWSIYKNKDLVTAIDGIDERTRKIINKEISNETIRSKIQEIYDQDRDYFSLKLYCLLGYPFQHDFSPKEILETICGSSRGGGIKRLNVLMVSPHFMPMPFTPMECEPLNFKNFRNEIKRYNFKPYQSGDIKVYWPESQSSSPVSAVEATIIHRASRSDAGMIKRIMCSSKYRGLNVNKKIEIMQKAFGPLLGQVDEVVPFIERTYKTSKAKDKYRKAVQLNGKDIITDPGGRVDPPSAGKGS